MKIFAFGGLGVDKKVFQNFQLDYNLTVIEWLVPESGEEFTHYLNRMAQKIDTDEPYILLGVSFGGMVAVELSHITNPALTIIVSSAASYKELPFIYRLFGKTNIISWLPARLLKPPSNMMSWLFGASSKKDKLLLAEIMKDTKIDFLRWAIGNIICWQNKKLPFNLLRIHGDKDRILPITKTAENHVIEGGGHFMIVTHSKRISELINDIIRNKL